MPLAGGEEEQVLETLYWYNSFRVGREGIYYIPHAQPNGGSTLEYLDFATGESRTLAVIERPVRLGLGISPDERMILFSQADQAGSDLMLVDEFRAP